MAAALKIIVLGATSGIGRALVEQYAQTEDCEVLATGRRAELLEVIAEKYPQVKTLAFDLTASDNLAHIQAAIDLLGRVDILIFNAGTGHVDPTYAPEMIREKPLISMCLPLYRWQPSRSTISRRKGAVTLWPTPPSRDYAASVPTARTPPPRPS